MNAHWTQQRERGTVFAMWLIGRLSLLLGRGFGRVLLYPICAYFILFSRGAVRASRQYLRRVLGRPVTFGDVFRHHYCFASTLLDRPFLLTGDSSRFDISRHGSGLLRGLRAEGRGCLLLGAHFGSFELARASARDNIGLTINMLMYEHNARKFRAAQEALGIRERMRVIPIGGVDALLVARECVERGEAIGMLGDRVAGSERVARVSFLGAPALFPVGPFLIASALGVPVVLFFGAYRGGNRYEEYFELLADRITLDRRRRETELEFWAGRYAERLEHHCRLAPYNWFNFFDFWAQDAASPAVTARRAA